MDDMIISRAEAKKIGNCNGCPAVTVAVFAAICFVIY